MNNLHVAGNKYLMALGTVALQTCLLALKVFMLIHTLGDAEAKHRENATHEALTST